MARRHAPKYTKHHFSADRIDRLIRAYGVQNREDRYTSSMSDRRFGNTDLEIQNFLLFFAVALLRGFGDLLKLQCWMIPVHNTTTMKRIQ